jgi:hypothetical protein
MLERCGSIAHHENHVDRRSHELVTAPRQRIKKETLMRPHRVGDWIVDHHRRSAAAFPF